MARQKPNLNKRHITAGLCQKVPTWRTLRPWETNETKIELWITSVMPGGNQTLLVTWPISSLLVMDQTIPKRCCVYQEQRPEALYRCVYHVLRKITNTAAVSYIGEAPNYIYWKVKILTHLHSRWEERRLSLVQFVCFFLPHLLSSEKRNIFSRLRSFWSPSTK